MRAQLRRANWGDEPVATYQVEKTTIGDITIDPNRHEVFKGDTQITLPLKEFELLLLLMRNAGQVLTRGILIDHIWGVDYYGDMKTLDVHIRRIRAKIETDPSNPKRILTIRGLGYKTPTHKHSQTFYAFESLTPRLVTWMTTLKHNLISSKAK